MGYVRRHLLKDEQVLYSTRLTSFVFFPWLLLTAGGALYLWLIPERDALYWVAVALAVLSFLRLLPRLFYYLSSEFAVTNKRVLGKVGILDIIAVDILLAKVESLKVEQSALGQFFNFGDVEVTGTGGTKETLMLLGGPGEFRSAVEQAVQTTTPAAAEP